MEFNRPTKEEKELEKLKKKFEELFPLIIPIVSVPELITIAEEADSPTQATNLAKKANYGESLVAATRWAAIIKRDCSELYKEPIKKAVGRAIDLAARMAEQQ